MTHDATDYAKTFRNPSFVNPSTGKIMPNDTGWQTRHLSALDSPKGFEIAIVRLIEAWAHYADAHHRRYESKLGNDSYLGPIWNDLGKSIHDLLDGETGRLDCGTLSSFIHNTRLYEGFRDE